MSDNPAKIAELQNDKLVEILYSKNLGVPVCRHIESQGHNGQQFVKPEYVIETFPSVEFLKSIKLIKAQIRTLVCVRTDLGVETSTVPYLEINNNASAAAASSSPSKTTTTSLTAEEAEKLLQEAAPLFTSGKYSEAVALYSKVIDNISTTKPDAGLKQTILSRALSNRSGCLLGLNNSKEALEDARRCVDVRPSWVRAHLRVAAAAEELEDFELAISAYESAMKAEDRAGKVPSNKELEAEILRVKQKNWKEVISETTNEFDTILSIETTTVASETIQRFCQYLQDFVMKKHSSSTRHKIAAREAFVYISKYCTTTDSAMIFCGTIASLINTVKISSHTNSAPNYDNKDENQKLFGTAAVRDALLLVFKYCTDPSSAANFCCSITALTEKNDTNKRLFGTAAVRDTLLLLSKYCTSADSAAHFSLSISNLNSDNIDNQTLFGTAAVRDALILVSKYCTDSDSALNFCASISNLTIRDAEQNLLTNENNQKVFGTAAVRDALLLVSKYCTNPGAESFCNCILALTLNNDTNNKLFATEPVRRALNASAKHAPEIASLAFSQILFPK